MRLQFDDLTVIRSGGDVRRADGDPDRARRRRPTRAGPGERIQRPAARRLHDGLRARARRRAPGVRPPAVPRGDDGRSLADVRGPPGGTPPGRRPPRRDARARRARGDRRAPAERGIDHRARRRPGARCRQVLRLDAPPADLPGPDGHDGQRPVRPPVRGPRPRAGPLHGLGDPGGGVHRLRRHRRGPAGPQPERGRRRPVLPDRPPRLGTGRPPGPDRPQVALRRRPHRRCGDGHGQRGRRPRRDPGGHRGGDPRPRHGPSVGRHDVPRLGLEPVPHRGRGALLLLQPRADHRPPLHPRPAGRDGHRRRLPAPGQRARADGDALHRAGVDIRPEAMGVTWDDVGEALRTLPALRPRRGPVVQRRRYGDDHRRPRRPRAGARRGDVRDVAVDAGWTADHAAGVDR